MILLAFAVSQAASAERNVHFTGDFESGRIQSAGSARDGFFVHTLPHPQSGVASVRGTESAFGPTDAVDTRVVPSEVVGTETVRPRAGQYFIRSALYFDKDYSELNADTTLEKPRSKLYMTNAAHQIEFDAEGYVGFSIYIPRSFEHETGTIGDRGTAQLFGLGTVGSASGSQIALSVYVPNGATEAHWFLDYWTGATSINEDDAARTTVDLGPVAPDLGKWTDFVIRYRFNPFSQKINPAVAGIPKSKNQVYEGNKGILQIWKAEGLVDPAGNRTMALKIDKINEPVGLVPDANNLLVHRWRIYKYGWQRNPTSVRGPVWVGFDEIRQGLVERDNTGYADVNPSGRPCTVGCPDGATPPNPPEDLKIVDSSIRSTMASICSFFRLCVENTSADVGSHWPTSNASCRTCEAT
jgi:hypothetical protein